MQSAPSQDVVSLNVGGMIYSTRGETLGRFPDSMLGALSRGHMPSSRDPSGNIFIDRDGKPFRHILNYLRSSHLDLPEGYREMRLLQREADFYQVQPLLVDLSAQILETSPALIQCSLRSKSQILHFTLKEGPLHYALSTCPVTTYTAKIFSTSASFLDLLRDGLEMPPADGDDKPSVHQQELHQPSIHQQELHQPSIHQQELHQPSIHQQMHHKPSIHQQMHHQPSIHQQEHHQPSIHQREHHQPSIHQQMHHQPSIHQQEHHQPSIHQREHHQPSIHQQELHQPSIHQQMHHQPSIQQQQHHLSLEWTPRPALLPEVEYAKHGFRPLHARPGGHEVPNAPVLVEMVLTLALGSGFRLDSAHPDPSDVLGSSALRLVRY